MDTILTTFVQHDVLQGLEVLCDRSLMTVDAVLQLRNHTDGLSTLIDHREGL